MAPRSQADLLHRTQHLTDLNEERCVALPAESVRAPHVTLRLRIALNQAMISARMRVNTRYMRFGTSLQAALLMMTHSVLLARTSYLAERSPTTLPTGTAIAVGSELSRNISCLQACTRWVGIAPS